MHNMQDHKVCCMPNMQDQEVCVMPNVIDQLTLGILHSFVVDIPRRDTPWTMTLKRYIGLYLLVRTFAK